MNRLTMIFLVAITFAAVQWGSQDVRFGVAILFVAFIAFLAGRRTAGKRWLPARYQCEYCRDTGIQPGADHGRLITLPAPCIHCPAGEKAGVRFREAVENLDIGGLPPAGEGAGSVDAALEHLSLLLSLLNLTILETATDNGTLPRELLNEMNRALRLPPGVGELVEERVGTHPRCGREARPEGGFRYPHLEAAEG